MARRCFYSFHYARDSTRAAQVRNIGTIEGNRPASDNEWTTITRGGEPAIKRWIASQMVERSCTVVLVGTSTADRPWINHEIVESWNRKMGVVGIRIHGLKDLGGLVSGIGNNPFDFVTHRPTGQRLSALVHCYDPGGAHSKARYAWIAQYLGDAVEEAVAIRNAND
jgi:MTH538 TIR-like domain (DUF1863)